MPERSIVTILLCAGFGVARGQPAAPVEETPTDETPGKAKPVEAKPTSGTSLSKLDTTQIEQLFNEGTKHYDLGQWDQAIASFKQAYALMPDPSFLFNLGQAYKQKGACRDATAAYVAYLRKAPDEDRTKVEGFIRELEPCAKLEDEKARRSAPRPREKSWPRTLRWTGYGIGGTGVALLGVGALFALRAHSAESDFEKACAVSCPAGSELDRLEQRGRDSARNAKAFYIGGASTLVIGGVLAAIGIGKREWIVVTPTAGGGVATVGAHF